MAYTPTTYLNPVAFTYPRGLDNTQHNQILRGNLFMSGGAANYSVGGLGSTSFEVTDVTAAGVATYAALVGLPLRNGQKVVIVSTSTAGNSGVKVISAVTPSSAVAGTFQMDSFGGVHDSTQTAQGVGQIQFGEVGNIAQTFTVASVLATAQTVAYTYTTLTGPQVQPGQTVTIAGCSHAGNNGTFIVKSVVTTSITAGTITAFNAGGTTTDSGTGKGYLRVGLSAIQTTLSPTQVRVWSTQGLGYIYEWNPAAETVQVFLTGTAATDPLLEAAVATTIVFDTLQFEAVIPRAATL